MSTGRDRTSAYPVLVFIRGLPGSGKSTLANLLSRALRSQNIVLDPDEVDQQATVFRGFSQLLLKAGVPKELHVYRFLRQSALENLEGGNTVIWNQPFTDVEVFRALVRGANNLGQRPRLILLELDIDPDFAYSRVRARADSGGHHVPRARFSKYCRDYTSYRDLGLPTLRLDGDGLEPGQIAFLAGLIDWASATGIWANDPGSGFQAWGSGTGWLPAG